MFEEKSEKLPCTVEFEGVCCQGQVDISQLAEDERHLSFEVRMDYWPQDEKDENQSEGTVWTTLAVFKNSSFSRMAEEVSKVMIADGDWFNIDKESLAYRFELALETPEATENRKKLSELLISVCSERPVDAAKA